MLRRVLKEQSKNFETFQKLKIEHAGMSRACFLLWFVVSGYAVSPTSQATEYRSNTGSGNNQAHPAWGSSSSWLRNGDMPTTYQDGFSVPISTLPHARLVLVKCTTYFCAGRLVPHCVLT